MNINNLENKFKNFSGRIYFNYSLKNLNWFNIGGNTKIYFKPDTLQDLIEFLKLYKYEEKLFVIGAGSNVLFKDDIFEGTVIKLGKNFSRISLLNENTIIAGSGALDKSLSEFALKNSLGGFEFLSCIPGGIGGAITMNSGCYDYDISQIFSSLKAINFSGNLKSFNKDDVKFFYRGSNLPKDLIILSAVFEGQLLNIKCIKFVAEFFVTYYRLIPFC